MSIIMALLVGFAGSLIGGTLALIAFGEVEHRRIVNLPTWTEWPILFVCLIFNVTGWIIAVAST